MNKKTNKYNIIGTIIDKKTKTPLQGYHIKAYDIDQKSENDYLGSTKTDSKGKFVIHYQEKDFVKDVHEAESEGGADIVLHIYDPSNKLIHTAEQRLDSGRIEPYNIEVSKPVKLSLFEQIIEDEDVVKHLEKMKINSIELLRKMDVHVLAETPYLKSSGINSEQLYLYKKQAELIAIAPNIKTVKAMAKTGFLDISTIASASPVQVESAIREAVEAGRLAVENIPDFIDIEDSIHKAKELSSIELKRIFSTLSRQGDMSCTLCDDDCCGDASKASMLSKRAYIAYLVSKFDIGNDKLSKLFRQEFASADCEEISLIRMGTEVLERGLLSNDFMNTDKETLFKHMLIDKAIIRCALIRLTETPNTKNIDLGSNSEYRSPFDNSNFQNETEFFNNIDSKNKELSLILLNESNLGKNIIQSAWISATRQDLEKAEKLSNITDIPDIYETNFAISHRKHLIKLTRKNPNELRAKYHVNFLATQGTITRCDQAIITLQEALRCGEGYYISCCDQNKFETGKKFYDYSEYQLKIHQLLYPEHFYDLHVKSSLLQGNVEILKEKLEKSETILEKVIQRDESLVKNSVMELFKLGFKTIRELLYIDELIAKGHIAHRDEEYGIALSLYHQAQELIQKHVQTFYSQTLPSYEEMFYGVRKRCADENYLVLNASELLKKIRKASLRPAFTKQLLSSERLKALDKRSDWWVSDGLIPTFEDLRETWDDFMSSPEDLMKLSLAIISFDPAAIILYPLFSKIVRKEEDLEKLRNLYDSSDSLYWRVHDVKGGKRFNLPVILKNFDIVTFAKSIEELFQELLFELAHSRIIQKLESLFDDIEDYISDIISRLRRIWLKDWDFPFAHLIPEKIIKTEEFLEDLIEDLGCDIINLITSFIKTQLNFLENPIGFFIRNPLDILEDILSVIGMAIDLIESNIRTFFENIIKLKDLSPSEFAKELIRMPENIIGGSNECSKRFKKAIEEGVSETIDFFGEVNDLLEEEILLIENFSRSIINNIYKNFVEEEKSIWISKSGSIQEVSNLYSEKDILNKSFFRRGTILFDNQAINNSVYTDYQAVFKINTGDNDDIGIAFRANETNNSYSYYLLSMRNGDGEDSDRDTQKMLMQIVWTIMLNSLLQKLSFIPILNTVLPLGFIVWLAGELFINFKWDDIFPEDNAGSFVRLIKVKSDNSSVCSYRVLKEIDYKIDLNQDYVVRLALLEFEEKGLDIKIEVSKPEDFPLFNIHYFDPVLNQNIKPIGPGGVGFYSFGNDKAIFKQADVTYYPSAKASAGKLFFVPKAKDGLEPEVDISKYFCRMQSYPKDLSKWISVNIDDFDIVKLKGPDNEGDRVYEDSQLDLSIYSTDNANQKDTYLSYQDYDPIVDRFELADLTNQLTALLPHYYYYVLPLSIGDSLHSAGEYERAKQHYDLIYDIFPNEVEQKINDNEVNCSDSIIFADPPPNIKYPFLHSDIIRKSIISVDPLYLPSKTKKSNTKTILFQRGVEEALLKSRHAANFLLAGEAAYFNDTPENRQLAFEMFNKVLNSYGRKNCCTNWKEGEAICGQIVDRNDDTNEDSVLDDSPEIPKECKARIGLIHKAMNKLDFSDQVKIKADFLEIQAHYRDDIDTFCKKISILFEKVQLLSEQECELIFKNECKDVERKFKQMISLLNKTNKKIFDAELSKIVEIYGDNTEKACFELSKLLNRLQAESVTEYSISYDTEKTYSLINSYEKYGLNGFYNNSLISLYLQKKPRSYQETNTAHSTNMVPFASHSFMRHNDQGNNAIYTLHENTETNQTQESTITNSPFSCEDFVYSCLELENLRLFESLSGTYSCVPINPLIQLHTSKACMYLENLDNNVNILGMNEDHISQYRFDYLISLAKNYINFAISAEKDFILFREKLASSRISKMQQEHALQLIGSQLRVKSINKEQAANNLRICDYQINRCKTLDDHLSKQLSYSDMQLTLSCISGGISAAIGIGTIFAGLAGFAAGVPTTEHLGQLGSGSGNLLSSASNILNVYQQHLQLEQSQELLRNYDLPIANLNRKNAEIMETLAQRQIESSLMEMRFNELVLTYISNQFLNADMYSFLARQSKQNYRQYLNYATRLSLMAEKALEMTQGKQFNIIKLNYFDVSVQGLMGGESLQQDLKTLEYQKLVKDERKQYPPAKIYSLSRHFPLEFYNFLKSDFTLLFDGEQDNRKKGRLIFRTDLLDFDLDFPGHYHRQIQSVKIKIFALTGNETIKATLTQIGSSQIVTKQNDQFKIESIPNTMEKVVLTSSPDGNGLIPLNPRQEKMNPFEGSGVACWWMLEIPPISNNFNFETIADIQFIIEYSALEDENYEKEVTGRITNSTLSNTMGFRLSLDFPDVFYHLLNPGNSGPEFSNNPAMNINTFAIEIDKKQFPFNEENRKFTNMTIVFWGTNNRPIPLQSINITPYKRISTFWENLNLVLDDDNAPICLTKDGFTLDLKKECSSSENYVFVKRNDDIIKIESNSLMQGEFPVQDGIWYRVLRNSRLIWTHESEILDNDIRKIDPTAVSLPQIIPVELFDNTCSELFQTKIEKEDTDQKLNTHTFIFEDSSISFDIFDQFFITIDPEKNIVASDNENNVELTSKFVNEYEVIDLKNLSEVMILINYNYKKYSEEPEE